MKINLTKNQLIHWIKVVLWIGASSAIAGLIAWATNNPALGVLAPVINAALVLVQQLLANEQPQS